MDPVEIKVGKTYRGKRAYKTVFSDLYDDRTVLWVSEDRLRVQYDSPAVRIGRRYPTVSMEKFCRWAKCVV